MLILWKVEPSATAFRIYDAYRESSETRSSPVWEDPWRCSQTTENRVETQLLCRSLVQKEKRILSEHQEISDHVELRAGQAARGDKVPPSRLSVAEYHTRLLLGEPKNHTLSEARSELDMQELRVESGKFVEFLKQKSAHPNLNRVLPGWSSVVPVLAALLCLLCFPSGFSTLVISGVLRCLLTFLVPSSVCECDVQEESQQVSQSSAEGRLSHVTGQHACGILTA